MLEEIKIEKNNKEVPVMIEVNTIQDFRDSEPEEINLITEGKMYKKDSAIYLTYDESEISEMENNRVILKIQDDTFTMHRFGEFESRMVFKKGKRDVSVYTTPFGEFRIEILTDLVKFDIAEKKGVANVDYTVSVSGSPEVKHNLTVSYNLVGSE